MTISSFLQISLNFIGITSCADFSWMSRLRYYWVARDAAAPSKTAGKGSKQGNVESSADEDSLATGSNVELHMLHSR